MNKNIKYNFKIWKIGMLYDYELLSELLIAMNSDTTNYTDWELDKIKIDVYNAKWRNNE